MNLLNQKKITIITNIIAPYRTPLFECLSNKYNLFVLYLQKRDDSRKWEQNYNSLKFNFKSLNSLKLNIFFGKTIFLPRIITLFKVITKSNTIIAIDNPPNLLSLLFIFFISKILRKKFIFWVSIWDKYYFISPNNLFTRIIKYYVIQISKYSDSIICYGESAKMFLVKNGLSKDKIFIGTQVHPESYNESINHIYMTNQKEIKILSLSYLQKRKGIADIINVVKSINSNNIRLNILGVGPELNALKNIAGSDERIVFHGYKDGKDKYALLKTSDIMVCSTYMDPWSLNVNEAISFKLPIIVSDSAGCASELVKGNGMTYKAGDIEDLKRKLEYLINNKDVRINLSKRNNTLQYKLLVNYAEYAFSDAIRYAISQQ